MKPIKLVILTCLLFSGCKKATYDPELEYTLPESDVSPPRYELPPPDSYTYIPVTNQYQFANTAGGHFRVTQVYVYKQDFSQFRGIASDGTYIYILNDNSKLFAGSYNIKRFTLDGTLQSNCTWFGDGHSYSAITVENNTVYLKRYDYGIKIVKYDYANCAYVSTMIINPGGPDVDGYSYVSWNKQIYASNGSLFFYFSKQSQSRIKSYSPTNLLFQTFAEPQSIGSETLSWDSDFFFVGSNIWTTRACKSKSNTICLWRANSATRSLAYTYLPKEYYPEMDNGNYSKTALLPGTNSNLIYSVFTNGEVHFYVLDVSKF